MNTKMKLIIAVILVLLGLLFIVGNMFLFSIVYSNNQALMSFIAFSRFSPRLMFALLGGLLLGAVWGASVAAIVVIIGFVLTGFGLFLPESIWVFPTTAFVHHIVIAAGSGFFIKKASSYRTIALVVLCAMTLGYLSEMVVLLIQFRAMHMFPNFLWIRIQTFGLGVLVHASLVPAIYLFLQRVLPTGKTAN